MLSNTGAHQTNERCLFLRSGKEDMDLLAFTFLILTVKTVQE